MNENELIEALRRTLHSRAAAVKPSNRPIPHAPAKPGRLGQGVRRQRVRRQRVRPMIDRPWALVGAGIVAAGAAAAIGVAVSLSGASHKISVTPGNPSPGISAPTSIPPVRTSKPLTTSVSPPPIPVPTGFHPVSATFVSADSGWVLGLVPCGHSSCASVARTTNRGATWSSVAAPPLTLTSVPAATQTWIRFYNLTYGWIVSNSVGGVGPSQLWYTRDGGGSWQAAPLPGGGSGNQTQIMALEASKGVVHAVAIFGGVVKELIYSSPVDHMDWQPAPTALKIGGGPVPTAELTLFDNTGWIIAANRTTIDGAELIQGQWNGWAPPCATANGTGVLAAASATDLVAACHEGAWGPSAEKLFGPWIFDSTDGGRSFSRVAPLPSGTDFTSITAAPTQPQTIVVGTGTGLLASFDGGHTWQSEYTAPSNHQINFVGFTTATQALAIESSGDGTTSSLLMTHDGGHTWSTVGF